MADPAGAGDIFGVGIDPNIITASFRALIGGANRAAKRLPDAERRRFCGLAD